MFINQLFSGNVFSAAKTLLVSRVLVPSYFAVRLRHADRDPVFLLNAAPVCLSETSFFPDCDAVYVTHRGEVNTTLEQHGFRRQSTDQDVQNFVQAGRLIYDVFGN